MHSPLRRVVRRRPSSRQKRQQWSTREWHCRVASESIGLSEHLATVRLKGTYVNYFRHAQLRDSDRHSPRFPQRYYLPVFAPSQEIVPEVWKDAQTECRCTLCGGRPLPTTQNPPERHSRKKNTRSRDCAPKQCQPFTESEHRRRRCEEPNEPARRCR